jgi:hypothetical protein
MQGVSVGLPSSALPIDEAKGCGLFLMKGVHADSRVSFVVFCSPLLPRHGRWRRWRPRADHLIATTLLRWPGQLRRGFQSSQTADMPISVASESTQPSRSGGPGLEYTGTRSRVPRSSTRRDLGIQAFLFIAQLILRRLPPPAPSVPLAAVDRLHRVDFFCVPDVLQLHPAAGQDARGAKCPVEEGKGCLHQAYALRIEVDANQQELRRPLSTGNGRMARGRRSWGLRTQRHLDSPRTYTSTAEVGGFVTAEQLRGRFFQSDSHDPVQCIMTVLSCRTWLGGREDPSICRLVKRTLPCATLYTSSVIKRFETARSG